ncbi:hypothetical protein [Staphylococcus hominis]|uniref:hypothetical protein n=1 Tax=Staphylococcus hominis TaxID=1290 RepID=UPI00287A8225|nr:hypothetical protein [Staphylococcus hominis]MDS3856915.1 hypothetical protein [Staphylococcus hominis]
MKLSSWIIALVTGILIFIITFYFGNEGYFGNAGFLSSLFNGGIGFIGVALAGNNVKKKKK